MTSAVTATCPIDSHTDEIEYIRLAPEAPARSPLCYPGTVEPVPAYWAATHILRCERHDVDLYVPAESN